MLKSSLVMLMCLVAVSPQTRNYRPSRRDPGHRCDHRTMSRESYGRCLRGTALNVNGFQPSCFRVDPETKAVAKIDSSGSITGTNGNSIYYSLSAVISFHQLDRYRTRIYAVVKGANVFVQDSPNMGIHVHMYGETNPSCSSTGSHYNPCGRNHSDVPAVFERHVGDVAFATIPAYGDLVLDIIDTQVKLSGPLSVLGRSVTIHGGASQARVGCAPIVVTDFQGERHPDTY